MIKLTSFIILMVCLTGCSKGIDKMKIPKTTEEFKEASEYIRGHMTGEEKDFALEVLHRLYLLNASSYKFKDTDTIGSVIKEYKIQRDKENALIASQKQVINKMNQAVKVEYLATIDSGRVLKIEEHAVAFTITNLSDKTINDVDGILVFKDPFGTRLGEIPLRYHGNIAPGKTIGQNEWSRYHYFTNERYRPSDVIFEPGGILFNDGSKLSIRTN